MHKEKVARRGIGTLASSKPTGRGLKITATPEQEKPASYSSKAIDFSALDHLGIFFIFFVSFLNEQYISLHTHCHPGHNFKFFKISSHHKISHTFLLCFRRKLSIILR